MKCGRVLRVQTTPRLQAALDAGQYRHRGQRLMELVRGVTQDVFIIDPPLGNMDEQHPRVELSILINVAKDIPGP
jgi:hypothetical protein